MPNVSCEEGPDRTPPPEAEEEQVARHHGRQDQGQVDEGVQKRLAPEAAPREQIGDEQRDRQASRHGDRGDDEAQANRGPLVG